MRINPLVVPLAVIVALLGTVAAAQAAGLWTVTGRLAVEPGKLVPADLKGWMTLQQVIDGVGISQAELYGVGGLPPEVPPSTALKDLEELVPGFEVSLLREALEAWAAGRSVTSDAAAAPPAAEPADLTPVVTVGTPSAPAGAPEEASAVSAPATHTVQGQGVGDGQGTGPTPLPPGQSLPGNEVRGRMSLGEVSSQCAVSLADLLASLGLPPDTDPGLLVKDLVAQGQIESIDTVRAAVTGLQTPGGSSVVE
jgi:hypothetical protein